MNKQGMTLVEVVVSLALLAILGMAFVTLFFSSTSLITSSNNNKLAELELRKYADGELVGDRNVDVECHTGAKIAIRGLSLEIDGQWCVAKDLETGVHYEYFSN